MKATVIVSIILGACTSLVTAQLDGLPSCAVSCGTNAIGSSGCDISKGINSTCICSNNAFISGIKTCIGENNQCSCSDQQKVLQFALKFCGSTPVNTTGFGAACGGFPGTSGTASSSASASAPSATGNSTSASSSGSKTSPSASASASATTKSSAGQNTYFQNAFIVVSLAGLIAAL